MESSILCDVRLIDHRQLSIIGGAGGLTTGIQAKILNNLPRVVVKAKVAMTVRFTRVIGSIRTNAKSIV